MSLKRLLTLLSLLFVASVYVWAMPASVVAQREESAIEATFTVNSTADPGNGVCNTTECTLREAIEAANASPGRDLIAFNILGVGPHTIRPITPLPTITDPIEINGYTQPGALPNTNPVGQGLNTVLMIELDGSQTYGTGLWLSTGIAANAVRGLVINRFEPNIHVESSWNSVISGNYIGTDVSSTSSMGYDGIYVSNYAPWTHIGGTLPAERNLIAGNTRGISLHNGDLSGTYATVQGNLVGTDASGTSALPNGTGIEFQLDASHSLIGGDEPGAANVVSGNSGCAIFMFEAYDNQFVNNLIGTDVTGKNALPNDCGLALWGGAGLATAQNEIRHNMIAFNIGDGIVVRGDDSPANAADSNRITQNVIVANGGLGIDLHNGTSTDSVTPNDAGDPDTGANNLQNYPILTSAIPLPNDNIAISGSLDSNPNTTFRVELFANESCDPSGHGEGQQYLNWLNVTTDGSGTATFTITFQVSLLVGRYLTATATHADGSTSEFSPCFAATDFPLTFVVNSTDDPGDGACAPANCTLREAIEAANASTGRDLVAFDIPGDGPHTIRPITPLPTITDPIEINGYTQPGALPNTNPTGQGLNTVLMTELDGSLTSGDGLVLSTGTDANVIEGLAINGFAFGIYLENTIDSIIRGNYLGTDPTGSVGVGGGGIFVNTFARSTQIGGLLPAERNLISGGYYGIAISDDGYEGNYATVQGNLIGTDATGTLPLPNTTGIYMWQSASYNLVGGPESGATNVISGNTDCAINLYEAYDNQFINNLIGTDITGDNPLPNGCGISLTGGIGFATVYNEIHTNTIAYNLGNGIGVSGAGSAMSAAYGNEISGNAIFANGGMGIDLHNGSSSVGVTPNDPLDADLGANNLQNYPELAFAASTGSGIQIQGSLSSVPDSVYRVEFFANRECDASGHGEGHQYLGHAFVATNAVGLATFDETVPPNEAIGQFLTATATGADGSTSEFSECRQFENVLAVELVSFTASAETGGSVTLMWETALELDNAGFLLYRRDIAATEEDDERITLQLIASQSALGQGASYTYNDTPGSGFWIYTLSAVDMAGEETLLTTARVAVETPTSVTLVQVEPELANTLVAIAALLAVALALLVGVVAYVRSTSRR